MATSSRLVRICCDAYKLGTYRQYPNVIYDLMFNRTPVSTSKRLLSSTAQHEGLTLVEERDGIKTITLNNPGKRNALSLSMLTTLLNDLQSTNDEMRVIVLRANGNVFSSGHDLKELTSKEGREYHSQVFSMCTAVMSLIPKLPVPVIAQVSGLATAAGCQLVASCDIAIASHTSQFATPGVKVGLFCSTPAVALARSVPRKVAMEMLFTGDPISAQDALRHGLVSRVVPDEDLENETMAIAQKICRTSRKVIEIGKACFYSQITMDKESAYRLAESTMVENLQFDDGREGIDAFVAKREPQWTHK